MEEQTIILENISIDGIKEVLPHREPFLLIDTIVTCAVGKSCTALWHLTGEEYFFQGHFPEMPVLPGVLELESMAQAGAFAVLSREEWQGRIALFGGVDKVRFRRQVVPGDVLQLDVEMTRLSSVGGKGIGRATVGGELACQAELTFAFPRNS